MSPSPDRNKIIFKDRPPIAGDINKAISHHFQSKKEEQTAIKHYPEWDVVKGEPLIELMRVERELLAAEADLETKRIEYNSQKYDWEIRWKELRDKHKLLKQSFLKFDEFIKENREKRERAERKISDEKERQKIREVEIVELERTLEYMEKIRAKMQHCVKEYEPFQKYLESVLGTEFQSIAEIFNRYDTLLAARTAVVQDQDENLQALEDTSAQLQKMTEEKSQSLMDLNSRLAHLQGRHERARANALHWETIVAHVKEVALHKELEDTQVRACIWNLYRQICTRKGMPVEAKRDQLEQQLLHIKRTIIELGKIVRAAKRKAAKEEKEKELKKEKKKLEEKSSFDIHGAKLTDIKSARSSIVTTRSFVSSIGDSVSLRRI